jgi:hypothetical protein
MSEDKKSRSEEALERIRAKKFEKLVEENKSGRKILKKLAKENKSKESKIHLSSCDLSEAENLNIKDGAEVILEGNLPEPIDFSGCGHVGLSKEEGASPTQVKFRKGKKVADVSKLPEPIDFRGCSKYGDIER